MKLDTKCLSLAASLAALVVLACLPSCGCGSDRGLATGGPPVGCPPPPFVRFVGPVEGAIDVAVDTEIVVDFSTAMEISSVNGQTFVVVERGGPIVPGQVFFSPPGLQARFVPSADLLPCTLYDIAVSGEAVDDVCGQRLAPFASSFTTTGVNCAPPPPPGQCLPSVDLGTAETFAVLAGSTITNTGPTTLDGDLGLHPGTAVTGAPVVTGTTHIADAVALQAKNDLVTAYNAAAAVASTATRVGDIGGQVLTPGVYTSSSALSVEAADLILVGGPDDVFIFQMASTLTVGTNRKILLQGVRPCNVLWQVGSSAVLETGVEFAGTILALTSITLKTGATADGRMLAQNGAVTLDTNVVIVPAP